MSTVRHGIGVCVSLVCVGVVLVACSGGSSRSSTSSAATTPPTSATSAPGGATSSSPVTGPTVPTTSASHSPVVTGTVPTNAPPTVPSASRSTRKAVQPSQTAQFGGNVSVKLVQAKAYQGKAQGPGEIAGPAVAFTLRISNGSSAAVGIADSVVTAYYGSSETPANPLSGSPNKPWSGSVSKGSSADGVYCFTIPSGQRGLVTLNISYDPSKPVVIIRGRVG